MSSTVLVLLLFFVITMLPESTEGHSIRYSTVTGFFQQDLASTNDSTFDFIASNFGLLPHFDVRELDGSELELREKESEKSGTPPWDKFAKAVEELNRKAPANVVYKVLYMARHGEGFHNVAEAFYGTPLWNCFWSLQNGNGTITWVDAALTPNGILQAEATGNAWKTQIGFGIPLPQFYYSSPLIRAVNTLQLTFGNLTLKKHGTPTPLIKELFRETIDQHTCDERSNKTVIHKQFPQFNFEKGFAEADPLFGGPLGESDSARDVRLKKVIDDVFMHDESTYISITAHSGALTSALNVIGHRAFGLSTGAMIPAVVKAEFLRENAPTPSVAPGNPVPTCATTPTNTGTAT